MEILDRHADKWTPTAYGCWVWTAAVNRGKGELRPIVGIARTGKIGLVARLICEEVYGSPPPDKPYALHDTPNGCLGDLCVRPSHLRWGNQFENMADIPAAIRSERSVKRQRANPTSPEQFAEWNRARRSDADREAVSAAKIAGQKSYLSNRACPHGHVGLRYTINGNCVICSHERVTRSRQVKK